MTMSKALQYIVLTLKLLFPSQVFFVVAGGSVGQKGTTCRLAWPSALDAPLEGGHGPWSQLVPLIVPASQSVYH